MIQLFDRLYCVVALALFVGCSARQNATTSTQTPIKPALVSERVLDDSDDPAIWIHPTDPAQSIILGTDKHRENGGVYVFGLDGKIDRKRTVLGIKRANNVDVGYGLGGGKSPIDIAVFTERDRHLLRIFRLPDMQPVDGGGIPVFENEAIRDPMGIALYQRPSDKAMFVIVGRKSGPAENYLEQYQLQQTEAGQVTAKKVRNFGRFSGKKEIESIAVDSELGFVYYSDEQVGVRKYYADPARGNEELALFGQGDFVSDVEGISIYSLDNKRGYILVSNQQDNSFLVYPREGSATNPHDHKQIARLPLSTQESDGSDVTSVSLPGFVGGLFVAMSTDGTFQFYRWTDLARRGGLAVRQP